MIMDKYNFAKRLKLMLANECEITRMENKVARKSVKYYEMTTSLKTALGKQEHELDIASREMEKLNYCNEKLEEFILGEEERLSATRDNVDRLRKLCEEAEKKQLEQREQILMQMDFIHRLKESTQTYFNMDALPHRFQGVSICETESASQWKPFDVDVQPWMAFLEERLRLKQNNEVVNMDVDKAESDGDSDKENVVK